MNEIIDHYNVTLDEPEINRLALATWVKRAMPHAAINSGRVATEYAPITAAQAVYIADCLKRGETWRPERLNQEMLTPENLPSWVKVMPVVEENEWELAYADRRAKYVINEDLLTRGAAGDSEAAIKYCQRVAAGEVNNGPYAG